MFETALRAYLASAGGFLTKMERQNLVFSGKLITFEQGIRFFTDYLESDACRKVQRKGHKPDRCRAQFKLLESIRCASPNSDLPLNQVDDVAPLD